MASGERTAKSGGCPGAGGRDANRIAGVSGPGWRAGGATTSLSELKSLTQNPRPKGVGRPCYEAENSACRGEWRRESGSPRRAPNAGLGKRAWRTPTPHLSLSDRKVGQGLIVCRYSCPTRIGRRAQTLFKMRQPKPGMLNAGRRELQVIKIACPPTSLGAT